MNLRKVILNIRKMLLLTCLLILLAIVVSTTGKASSSTPIATVYIVPPTIAGETGEEFDATVMAKDFENLFGYGLGLHWDPNVMNCTEFRIGNTLADDVFDVLAPGRMILAMPGAIDNTLGRITLSAVTLTGATGVTGDSGVAYKLMEATFKVKASGVSDLHIRDLMLGDPDANQMPVEIIDFFTAWEENYPVVILTNSTGITGTNIFGHLFSPDDNTISFNLTSVSERDWSPGGTFGFCNVTIPKDLLWVDDLSEWAVKVNGNPPASIDPKFNGTHYFIYFTYDHTGTILSPETLEIQIEGKYSIPEFPTATILPLLTILTLIAVILGKLLWSKKRRGHISAS